MSQNGVYVGFNSATGSGSSGGGVAGHAFITIVSNNGGVTSTLEAGAASDSQGTLRLQETSYGNGLSTSTNPAQLVSPPAGVSESQFETGILNGYANYGQLSQPNEPDYTPSSSSNSFISGSLTSNGVDQATLNNLASNAGTPTLYGWSEPTSQSYFSGTNY